MTFEVTTIGAGYGSSSRLAAHRKAMGRYGTPAAEGLAKALARVKGEGCSDKRGETAGADVTADQGAAITSKAAPAKPRASAPKPAATAALSAEHARIAAVYASEGARGREGVCATLLAHPEGWSAAAIIAQLPHLATDREYAAQQGNFGWAEIHAEVAERTGRTTTQPQAAQMKTVDRGLPASQGNHGWDDIRAEVVERTGRAAAQPKPGERGLAAQSANHGWAEIHAEIAQRIGRVAAH